MFRILTVDELIHELTGYDYKEMHLHHTWKPDHSNFTGSNHLQLQKNMRDYHVNTNGWSDIGQHVTLMPDGKFVTGRDFGISPASIKGFNTGAFAVEMLGNFDIGHNKLEGKQKEAILKLARFFVERGKYIRFHRENASKTCPGTSIDKVWFVEQVKKWKDDQQLQKANITFHNKKLNGIVIGGTSYAPVRELAELLNLKVGWNNQTKTVELEKIK